MQFPTGGKFERGGRVSVQLTGDVVGRRTIWKLLDEVRYTNNRGVDVRVGIGFRTDFFSIPWLFWRIASPTGPALAASVVHDYLYTNQGHWDRKDVDILFCECMEVLGVPKWKRTLMYWSVRLGGWVAWNRNKRARS